MKEEKISTGFGLGGGVFFPSIFPCCCLFCIQLLQKRPFWCQLLDHRTSTFCNSGCVISVVPVLGCVTNDIPVLYCVFYVIYIYV